MWLTLLLRYWKASAVALVVVFVVAMIMSWRHALINEGRALQQLAHADSVLATTKTQLKHTDTVFMRDTVRLARARLRVDSLRDTLLLHTTDTLLVKEYVARTDTALKACSDLEDTCARFRVQAQARFDAYELKLKTQSTATPPGHKLADMLWLLSGVGLGVAVRSLHR